MFRVDKFIASSKSWSDFFSKTKELPTNDFYKEWETWGDFLGNGRVAARLKKFEDFSKGKKIARSLKAKSIRDYHTSRPDNIPAHPKQYYKEWVSWDDWLGRK